MSKKENLADKITFRPHKVEFICISTISIFLLLLSLWVAFLAGPVIYIAFLPLLMIMAVLLYYDFLYSALQITIDEQTITLENILTKESLTAKWTDFQNAYRLQDSKNHCFILLTQAPLSYEEQKKLRRKFYHFGKPHLSIDGNICFYAPEHQGTIQNIIQQQIPYHAQANEPRICW